MAQRKNESQLDILTRQLDGLLETSEQDLPPGLPPTVWSGLKAQREILRQELESRTTPGVPQEESDEADLLQAKIQDQKAEEAGVRQAREEKIAKLREQQDALILDQQHIASSATAKEIGDKVSAHAFALLTEEMDTSEKVGCFARFFCCCLPRVRNLDKLKTKTAKIEATLGHLTEADKLREAATASVDTKLKEIRAEIGLLEGTTPKITVNTVFTPPVRKAVRLKADLESLAMANENRVNKAITICLVKIRYLIKQILDYFAKQATLASPAKNTKKSPAKTTVEKTHPLQAKAKVTLEAIQNSGDILHTIGGGYSAPLEPIFTNMDGLKADDQRNVYQSAPNSAYIASTLIPQGVFDADATPIPPTHPRPAVPGSRTA